MDIDQIVDFFLSSVLGQLVRQNHKTKHPIFYNFSKFSQSFFKICLLFLITNGKETSEGESEAKKRSEGQTERQNQR